jgi:Sec-independent protein translocase protein TatA
LEGIPSTLKSIGGSVGRLKKQVNKLKAKHQKLVGKDEEDFMDEIYDLEIEASRLSSDLEEAEGSLDDAARYF